MTVPVVLAIAGVVALFLGVWGGGIKAKEIEIPPTPPKARLFVGVLGVVFIGISIWLSVLPSPGTQSGVSESPTPTDVIVVGVIDTQSPVPTNTPTPTNTLAATNTLVRPTPTATPELLSIVGTWKGTTTGTNASGPISERLTTVSIPVDCQVGKTCGFFITEGACNYELTLISIQDNTYNFNTLSVSGESFCTGGSVVENGLKITLRTNAEIYFYYKAGDVMREGILIK
jgi:hypothetical protein